MVHAYVRASVVRPSIDDDVIDTDAVQEYAEANGLRMPRAYAELINLGLDAVEAETVFESAVEQEVEQ